jgi:hypothetical protein
MTMFTASAKRKLDLISDGRRWIIPPNHAAFSAVSHRSCSHYARQPLDCSIKDAVTIANLYHMMKHFHRVCGSQRCIEPSRHERRTCYCSSFLKPLHLELDVKASQVLLERKCLSAKT